MPPFLIRARRCLEDPGTCTDVWIVAAAAGTGILIPPSKQPLLASLFPAGRLGLAKAVIIYFRARTFAASIPTLLAPGIILGGILFGVFTATEAPGIAVLYTLLLTVMHYRSIRISELPVLLLATARLTGVVVGLVGMASAIARVEMRRLFYPMAPFIVILASLPGISLAMPRAFGGYLGPWVQRPGATHQPRPI